MTHQIKVPNQRPDETVLIALRPHWIHLLNVFLLMLGLYLIPVILFLVMNQVLTGMLSSPPAYALAIMITTLYYLSVNLISFNGFLDRELDIWIVTNYRIIATEQKGLFNRTFAEHL